MSCGTSVSGQYVGLGLTVDVGGSALRNPSLLRSCAIGGSISFRQLYGRCRLPSMCIRGMFTCERLLEVSGRWCGSVDERGWPDGFEVRSGQNNNQALVWLWCLGACLMRASGMVGRCVQWRCSVCIKWEVGRLRWVQWVSHACGRRLLGTFIGLSE